jgi:hypothetical protein
MRLRLLSVIYSSWQGSRLAWGASNPVDVLHDVLSTWLQVGKEGDTVGYRLEVVNGESDVDGVCHGDEVEDSVGGSTKSHSQDLSSALPKS